MILVLEKGGNRGAEFLSGIIETFPDSAQDQLRRLDALKNATGVEDQINALGSRLYERVVGASAEVRFAAERVGGGNVRTFHFAIPGSEPDIVDAIGNLYEVKFRSWTDSWSAGTMEDVLEDIFSQVDIQQRYAAAAGKQFTLALEVPIPATHRALFDAIFGEFSSRGNVVIINGF